MTVYPALRESQIMNKTEVFRHIRESKVCVTVHEHIGDCTLYFENGKTSTYVQTKETLAKKLGLLAERLSVESVYAITYPMPPYKQFQKKDVKCASMHDINKCNDILSSETVLNGILPSILLTISEGCEKLSDEVANYASNAFCIKIHPLADMVTAKDVVSSDLFNLSLTYKIPITMHCSRPGQICDIHDIIKHIIPIASSEGVFINIAHAGFLDDAIFELAGLNNIFIDISPWSVLIDQLYGCYNKTVSAKMLEILFEMFPEQIMFGQDTPIDVQTWGDGSTHGNGLLEDVKDIVETVSSGDKELFNKLFRNNAVRFLSYGSY